MKQDRTLHDVALSDRYDLEKPRVLLSGTQALLRATLMQRARDTASGYDTAGYVTGYRGSPLGSVDTLFEASSALLQRAHIRFQPGLNEDLAATAIWGAQQAELQGEGLYQGVFALWYGKGPGVDRSGDVLRHANLAGTSALGGVLLAAGDDHTCESSTTCHQSELALIDAMIPILSPAGVQEILDYAVHGWALSRYSGCWVGLKSVKDTIEATAVVDADPFRITLADLPPITAEGGAGIRLADSPQAQEARLHNVKIPAAQTYARANGLDRRVHGKTGAKVGLVSAGKSWLDTLHALELLGLDEAALTSLGVTTYKVGMVWPLEPSGFGDWAEGLDQIIVIEEKRPVIEPQVRDYVGASAGVFGARDQGGAPLFRSTMDLNPADIALGLVTVLGQIGIDLGGCGAQIARLRALGGQPEAPDLAERKPWFCAGCPHSTSTHVPEGSRAYAGIGCHYMAQWMDRSTIGHTHMGGEGANWIGEAIFSKRRHVFQNMGDGTYNHSGALAIRAAVSAGTNITYKILYNDAVAMTGGQTHEGGLTPERIAAELLAFGVRRVVAVVDEKQGVPPLPAGVAWVPRANLDQVQRDLREVEGVTAILYIQTCAAEKRRRRKRGLALDPDKRVFINPAVCEGCGDCGKASNCVAILPLDTEFGQKRQIDQSSCNKDYSCLDGFCPSFVTLEGAKPLRRVMSDAPLAELAEPVLPPLDHLWSILITGIGGTGVVTVGAILTMAAHLEGKGAAELQMAGLAQKGGAVTIHCRIAPRPADITATRLAIGEADAVIAGDVVVAAGHKALSMMESGKTRLLANARMAMTGSFTRDPDFRLPEDALRRNLETRLGADKIALIDAVGAAERYLGDKIYSNVLLLGAAWQAGLVPVGRAALHRAIELNGAGVAGNLRAFEIGRRVFAEPAMMQAPQTQPSDLQARIDRWADHLLAYQGHALKARYLDLVARARQAENAIGADGLVAALAEAYVKLLAYKDEYEVARLHGAALDQALAHEFGAKGKIRFYLAPPLLARKGRDGRPRKMAFGPWIRPLFRLLAALKPLRGTPFDVFGHTAERRQERALITQYEADMAHVIAMLSPANHAAAVRLAHLPVKIRGFGHVKQANARQAATERETILAALA